MYRTVFPPQPVDPLDLIFGHSRGTAVGLRATLGTLWIVMEGEIAVGSWIDGVEAAMRRAALQGLRAGVVEDTSDAPEIEIPTIYSGRASGGNGPTWQTICTCPDR